MIIENLNIKDFEVGTPKLKNSFYHLKYVTRHDKTNVGFVSKNQIHCICFNESDIFKSYNCYIVEVKNCWIVNILYNTSVSNGKIYG